MTSTLRQLITSSLRLINVVQANEVPAADDMDISVEAFNQMLDSWSTEKLNIFELNPYSYSVTPGKKTYTLGPGGDWDTERPMEVLKMYVRFDPNPNAVPWTPPVATEYHWWPDTPINPGSVVKTFTDDNATVTISVIPNSTNAGMRTPTVITGKTYCEFELDSKSSNNTYQAFGIVEAAGDGFTPSPYATYGYNITSRYPTLTAQCGYSAPDLLSNGGVETYASRYAFGPGDRIGVAFDNATGQIWYSKNGAWIDGDPATGIGESAVAPLGTYYFTTTVYTCNAGGGTSFTSKIYPGTFTQMYDVPEGFLPYYNPVPPLNPGLVDLPMEALTFEQYGAITVKNTSSQLPLKFYDDGGYPTRTITIWPVPQRTKEIIIWQWQPLLNTEALDDPVNFPMGYERALRFALAVELAAEFGKEIPSDVARIAKTSKALIKRYNSKPQVMVGDTAIASNKPSLFNYIVGDTVGSTGLL